MAKTKGKSNSFIEMELTWLESQAAELKAYCDAMNVQSIKDRMVGSKCTATIEQQIACKRQTLQDYIKIMEAVDKLREAESSKKAQTRGDQILSPLESGEI